MFFSTSAFGVAVASGLLLGFFSSAIFPVMQALASDSAGGRTGTVLGLTTTFQSAAAVMGVLLPGALFTLGVGRALALGAMVPALMMTGVSLLLREPRGAKGED